MTAVILKKEVATLRACWDWAAHGEFVKGVFPGRGLRFPNEEGTEPFRIFAEIEAIIAAEKPDDDRRAILWEALYLTRPELEQFLAHLRQNATLPWLYPMVIFAAYTGARRSEMLRALATDADLAGGAVTIREKKRVVGKRSTRTAPLTPKLAEALGNGWLSSRTARPCSARRSTWAGAGRGQTARRP